MLDEHPLNKKIIVALAAIVIVAAGLWLAGYRSPADFLPPGPEADLYSAGGAISQITASGFDLRLPRRSVVGDKTYITYETKSVTLDEETEILAFDLSADEPVYRNISASGLKAGANAVVYTPANPEKESTLPATRVEVGE